jgi:hypothetical protein
MPFVVGTTCISPNPPGAAPYSRRLTPASSSTAES